jgi:hypothetical protein
MIGKNHILLQFIVVNVKFAELCHFRFLYTFFFNFIKKLPKSYQKNPDSQHSIYSPLRYVKSFALVFNEDI